MLKSPTTDSDEELIPRKKPKKQRKFKPGVKRKPPSQDVPEVKRVQTLGSAKKQRMPTHPEKLRRLDDSPQIQPALAPDPEEDDPLSGQPPPQQQQPAATMQGTEPTAVEFEQLQQSEEEDMSEGGEVDPSELRSQQQLIALDLESEPAVPLQDDQQRRIVLVNPPSQAWPERRGSSPSFVDREPPLTAISPSAELPRSGTVRRKVLDIEQKERGGSQQPGSAKKPRRTVTNRLDELKLQLKECEDSLRKSRDSDTACQEALRVSKEAMELASAGEQEHRARVAENEKRIGALVQTNKSLQSVAKDSKTQADAARVANEQLQKQINTLQKEQKDRFKDAALAADAAVRVATALEHKFLPTAFNEFAVAFRFESDKMQGFLEEMKTLLGLAGGAIEGYAKERKATEKELKDFEKAKELLRQQQTALEQLQKEVDSEKETTKNANDLYGNCQENLNEANDEIKKLKKTIARLNSRQDPVGSSSSSDELKQAQSEIARLEAELEEVKKQPRVSRFILGKDEEIKALKEQIEQLNTNAAAQTRAVEFLQAAVNEAGEQYRKYKEDAELKINQLNTQLSDRNPDCEERLRKANEDLVQCREELFDANQQLDNEKKRANNLQTTLNQCHADRLGEKKQAELNLETERKARQIDIQKLQGELAKEQAAHNATKELWKTSIHNRNDAQKMTAFMDSVIKQLTERANQADLRGVQLRSWLNMSEMDVKALEQKITESRKELDRRDTTLRARAEELSRANTLLDKEMTALRKANEALDRALKIRTDSNSQAQARALQDLAAYRKRDKTNCNYIEDAIAELASLELPFAKGVSMPGVVERSMTLFYIHAFCSEPHWACLAALYLGRDYTIQFPLAEQLQLLVWDDIRQTSAAAVGKSATPKFFAKQRRDNVKRVLHAFSLDMHYHRLTRDRRQLQQISKDRAVSGRPFQSEEIVRALGLGGQTIEKRQYRVAVTQEIIRAYQLFDQFDLDTSSPPEGVHIGWQNFLTLEEDNTGLPGFLNDLIQDRLGHELIWRAFRSDPKLLKYWRYDKASPLVLLLPLWKYIVHVIRNNEQLKQILQSKEFPDRLRGLFTKHAGP